MVPLVKITDLNLSNTFYIAKELSRQARPYKYTKKLLKIGSQMAPSLGLGSKIRVNLVGKGVATLVANSQMVINPENSSVSEI
jgi:hypothetical protein